MSTDTRERSLTQITTQAGSVNRMSAYQSPSAFVGLTPDEVELDGTLFSSFFVHRNVINLDHSSCPPNE
jgi:hypothetical protein